MNENANAPIKQAKFVEEINMHDLFAILVSEKWLVLSVMFFCLLASTLYLTFRTPKYQSAVIIQVNDKPNALNDFSGFSSMLGARTGVSQIDVQEALIKSRFILQPVIEQLSLNIKIDPNYFPIIGKWLAKQYEGVGVAPAHLWMNSFAWGGEKIHIRDFQVPFKEKIIKYKLVANGNNNFSLYDPDDQLILQGQVGKLATSTIDPSIHILVTELQTNNGTEFYLRKLPMSEVIKTLSQQLNIQDLGRNGPDSEQTGVLQISLIDPDPALLISILNTTTNILVQKDAAHKATEAEKIYTFLNQRLPVVQQSLNNAETALNVYRAQSGKIDLNVESKMLLNQLADIQKQLVELQLLKVQWSRQYTPLHPYMISIDERTADLNNQYALVKAKLKDLPLSDQVAMNMMRDVNVKNSLYLTIMGKMQDLEITKAGTISDVRVLSPAPLPELPVPSRWLTISLASLIFGFMLGSVLAFGRRSLLQYIDDPYWTEQRFNIPPYAIIPFSKTQLELYKTRETINNKRKTLLAETHPHDIAIEALRSLRTGLQFALLESKKNTISIIGLSPRIGKSFVSANFAYVLATAGKRVLLIDGDIRKGHIHKYFNLPATPGLSETLSDKIPLAKAISKTFLDTLDFIPTGIYPTNPAELLMSEQFKQLLATVASDYDLVIIDTAPVLAVTDGVIIGGQVGTNFLVVGSGVHRASELELAIKRLANSGTKIQGTIFNNLKPTPYMSMNPYKNIDKYYHAYNNAGQS